MSLDQNELLGVVAHLEHAEAGRQRNLAELAEAQQRTRRFIGKIGVEGFATALGVTIAAAVGEPVIALGVAALGGGTMAATTINARRGN